ncbi:MAG: hypothetical protein J6V83_06085, partial [Clostridia bacterium]|nr:hypothetical protein [Clostridia bacterium]
KIYKLYKSDIDLINSMTLNSLTSTMNKGTMPIRLYSGGICIKIFMKYTSNWNASGFKFGGTATSKWNDSSSSIEGATLQKGTFKKMSDSSINDLVGTLSKIPSVSVQ